MNPSLNLTDLNSILMEKPVTSPRIPRHSLLTHLVAATLSLTPLAATAAPTDDRESLETLRETTLNLIEALVEQGVFTRDKADTMIKDAQAKAQAAAKARPAAVRVQYVPETVKAEIREQLKQEVLAQARTERWAAPNAVPAWVDGVKWEGDLRVRYQVEGFDKLNTTPINYIMAAAGGTTRAAGFLGATAASPAPSANLNENTDTWRVRARLGMLARISDQWSAGVRLATGNTTNRVSTNQTLGQDWNKYSLVVDRAYIKYDPDDWLSVSAGRLPNPWFSTDLVWDEDLNFEGIAASLKTSLANDSFKPFLTVGAFPLKAEAKPTGSGRWVKGMQAGAQWDFARNTRLKFGAAWYAFSNLEGRIEDDAAFLAGNAAYGQYEYGSNLRQKGNTLFRTNAASDPAASIWGLASRFRPLNLTASLDLAHFDPVHVVLTGDYVRNTAFDRSEILARTGVNLADGKDYGYLAKLTLGMPKVEKRHDWQVAFAYRYLGSDAVVDAFTDSDFGLGGTNLKGYTLGFQYGLDRNASVGLRWYSADAIDSFSLVSGHRFAVDVLQADVNVRF